MPYHFSVTLETDRKSPVLIDPVALYGYWERLDGTEGGGLWFQRLPDGRLELVDSDGSYELRQDIVRCLRSNGYVLDDAWN